MPDTNSSGSGGTSVQTNGIGQHCDAHLNLTRSLADVDAGSDNAMSRAKARAAERRAYESELHVDRPFAHHNLLGGSI